MSGTPQVSGPLRGRSILVLSALALLAFWSVPVLAQASSAGNEYTPAPPSATGPPSESNLSGGSSPTSGVGGKGNGGSPGGSKGGSAAGSSKSKPGGGSAGQNGQGSSGEGGAGAISSGTGLGAAEPGSDSGGSSPLVPILIAIVLLAAGSVAFVAIRKRRADGTGGPGKPQAPGSPKSPGAAGAPGSSASPEAG